LILALRANEGLLPAVIMDQLCEHLRAARPAAQEVAKGFSFWNTDYRISRGDAYQRTAVHEMARNQAKESEGS